VKKGESMTVTRLRQSLNVVATVCLGGALFVGMGGTCPMVRAGEASLEFVGNLINGVHNISLDRLDPTCPQCF
jgi:hypothetical protein